MKKYIGCDLGGTNLRAAIVDVETGEVLRQMSVPTLARDGHKAVMKRMADLFLQVIQSAGMQVDEIGGIGIGEREARLGARHAMIVGGSVAQAKRAARRRGRIGHEANLRD